MIRERIKSETAQAHRDTESVSYGKEIMSGELSLSQYKELVLKNYIANEIWERTWEKLPFEVPANVDLKTRSKRALLKKDLELLGLKEPALPDHIRFDVSSFPAFLGTMYVFEGSMLGAAIIHKQLEKNEYLQDLDGFHFYSGYGRETGTMWKSFLAVLTIITNPKEEDAAVDAANKAFEAVHQAFVTDVKAVL
jgi:heme oxygenase